MSRKPSKKQRPGTPRRSPSVAENLPAEVLASSVATSGGKVADKIVAFSSPTSGGKVADKIVASPTLPWGFFVVPIGFLVTTFFREQVVATLRLEASPAVYQVLWYATIIAIWLAVRCLLILTARDRFLERIGIPVVPWGRLFFEKALVYTAGTTLWSLLTVVVTFASTRFAPTHEILDVLGRAAVLGILLGLLIQVPIWYKRYSAAYKEVRLQCGVGAWLRLHIAAMACDLVFGIAVLF